MIPIEYEALKKITTEYLLLEYYGVQLEQTVTDVPYGKPAIIKFSVPEKTQLEAKNGALLTTEYLIQEAKKMLY